MLMVGDGRELNGREVRWEAEMAGYLDLQWATGHCRAAHGVGRDCGFRSLTGAHQDIYPQLLTTRDNYTLHIHLIRNNGSHSESLPR